MIFALECLLLDQNQLGPILVQYVMVEVNRGASVSMLIMVIKFYLNRHVGGPLTITDANLCLGRLLPEYVHSCSSCNFYIHQDIGLDLANLLRFSGEVEAMDSYVIIPYIC